MTTSTPDLAHMRAGPADVDLYRLFAFSEALQTTLVPPTEDERSAEMKRSKQRIPCQIREAEVRWTSLLLLGLLTVLAVGLVAGCGGGSDNASGPDNETAETATAEPTSTSEATLVVKRPDDFGPGITVALPAPGWRFDADVGHLFKGDEGGTVPEAAILLWSHPAGTEFYVPGDACRSESTMPDTPATTPDEISAALAAQASRDASEAVDATIGGYAGESLTVQVPDDAVFADCEGETYLTYATGEDPGARPQQSPGQIEEIWVLDVNGAPVIISAQYRPDTRTELVEEMRSIAQSATFELP